MIEWNLGGWDFSELYLNEIYSRERSDLKCTDCTYETIWEENIALMYPSDYGFVEALSKCNEKITGYGNDIANCTETDWLFNKTVHQWMLTPFLLSSNKAFVILHNYWFGAGVVTDNYVVRPTLYLNSELVRESGEGSEDNPYVVG